MRTVRKVTSCILLVGVYCFTWLVAALGRKIPHRPWEPNGRIMVTGTIFNPNWYLSHVTPLVRSGVREVILVIDEPQRPLEGVRFACPPKWLAMLMSRSGAKAVWVLLAGIRYRPDLFMGYNLVAGSCTALVAGALLGRPACYQMTGGQLVLSTMDVATFNFDRAGRFHKRVLKMVERLAVRVIRQFDLVVVRGNNAKAFLAGYGITDNVAVITGSVKDGVGLSVAGRDIDIVFVGRLNPIKQVDHFIRVIHEVSRTIPSVKAAIVGDGALMVDMKAYAARLGVADSVEFLGKRTDVEQVLARSKVFLLTSKSEGLSIAMAEAMAAGAVPVVANVGELGDLVHDGINGYLIRPNDIHGYAMRAISLLQDQAQWTRLSSHAIGVSRECSHVDVIAQRWREGIQRVVERASGTVWLSPQAGNHHELGDSKDETGILKEELVGEHTSAS